MGMEFGGDDDEAAAKRKGPKPAAKAAAAAECKKGRWMLPCRTTGTQPVCRLQVKLLAVFDPGGVTMHYAAEKGRTAGVLLFAAG
jgi:hypothetical protein